MIEAKKRLEDVVPEMTLPTRSPETGDPKRQLKVGDQVILSDMSAYDAYDRIRLK